MGGSESTEAEPASFPHFFSGIGQVLTQACMFISNHVACMFISNHVAFMFISNHVAFMFISNHVAFMSNCK